MPDETSLPAQPGPRIVDAHERRLEASVRTPDTGHGG